MAESILTDESVGAVGLSTTLPVEELAETILEDSIWDARQKSSPTTRGSDLGHLLAAPAFFDALKHGLARHVAKALADNDPLVQSVYTYEPSTNPDVESGEDLAPSPAVHLLVRVVKPSAAQDAFVAALDRALTSAVRELPSPLFERLDSVLDVNLVTEKQIKLGTGFSALLTSLFAPPINLWQRES